MRISSFLLAAVLSAGTLFSAVAPAAAVPLDRQAISLHGDVIQTRGGDRDWGGRDRDDRDWDDRYDWGERRHWRERRYWRPAWGYERRWSPWQEERWRERQYWRRHQGGPYWLYRG
ncbi:hypothetical protein FHX08_001926 [Rhizobium sp. BK529]|uniref:hypothetical protein n=1 Tax=unclassified Rhizobium TaxID=2613769 RepID=UPI00104B10EB|nr:MULTISPECIES: hypothetical protein [unclassified Rhizobium]MBB3591582.1 hypothetical protein [Rhizobium sp. BK529]TCS08471.1 hypothetical protein EV281_101334 [Rhizobium sp. BK418]